MFSMNLASSSSCLREPLTCPEFWVFLFGLHDLIVAHLDLFFLFPLHLDRVITSRLINFLKCTTEQVTFLHTLQRLLTEVK